MNGQNDLISIIVPVYDVSKYLRQCLDSIVNQTYKNLEIILIDDGSTDDSGKICDEYAGSDLRITVVHQENAGQSAARNKGISIAHGKYIGFADSDDIVSENMFETLLDAMQKSGKMIGACTYSEMSSDGIVQNAASCSGNVYELDQKTSLDDLFSESKYQSFLWNKLFLASLVKEIQLPAGHIFEDYYVLHDVFGNSNGVVFIDKALYFYRCNETSTSVQLKLSTCQDYFAAIKRRAESVYANGRLHLMSVTMLDASFKYKLVVYKDEMSAKQKKEYYRYINSFLDKYCKTGSMSAKDKIKYCIIRYGGPRLIMFARSVYSKV